MKYSKAKKQIEALSSEYSVDMDEFYEYFNINYKGVEIAFVSSDGEYSAGVWDSKHFYKLPSSNKLYMILAELAITPLDERIEEKKYFIHVLKGQKGYLSIVDGRIALNNTYDAPGFSIKAKFTNGEINQLKQRDDVPLDWKKVKLEDAE